MKWQIAFLGILASLTTGCGKIIGHAIGTAIADKILDNSKEKDAYAHLDAGLTFSSNHCSSEPVVSVIVSYFNLEDAVFSDYKLIDHPNDIFDSHYFEDRRDRTHWLTSAATPLKNCEVKHPNDKTYAFSGEDCPVSADHVVTDSMLLEMAGSENYNVLNPFDYKPFDDIQALHLKFASYAERNQNHHRGSENTYYYGLGGTMVTKSAGPVNFVLKKTEILGAYLGETIRVGLPDCSATLEAKPIDGSRPQQFELTIDGAPLQKTNL